MSDKYIVCDNCGARCEVGDTYCKTCSQNILSSSFVDESARVIDGIDDEELEKYIGKKAKYYMNCFSRTKKKWFIQFNLWAFVFGANWFLYRKMRKIAVTYVVSITLFSCLLTLICALAFMPDLLRYSEAKEAYDEYLVAYQNGEVEMFAEGPDLYDPDYKKIRDEKYESEKTVKWVDRLIAIPVLIVDILFRLSANAVYKQYITKKYYCTVGGTSLSSAIWGSILLNILRSVIQALFYLIPVVLFITEIVKLV